MSEEPVSKTRSTLRVYSDAHADDVAATTLHVTIYHSMFMSRRRFESLT